MTLLTLFILLAGCSPVPLPGTKYSGTPLGKIENTALIAELNRGIGHQYPNRFKAVHHVALTLMGKTYVLNGYLMVNRSERQIHLIAQNDMGGTLFEIHIRGGKTSIQSKTNFLKTNWLEKSVVKDIENLYLNTPLSSPRLSSGQDNLFLLSEDRGGISREYLLKKDPSHQDGYQLMGYKQIRNKREIYAIDYIYDGGNNKKKTEKYPPFIAIDDHTLHYQLKINIKYFIPPEGEKEEGNEPVH